MLNTENVEHVVENVVEQMLSTENVEHVVENVVEQMLNTENVEHVVENVVEQTFCNRFYRKKHLGLYKLAMEYGSNKLNGN